MGTVSVWEEKKVLGLDSGDGYTTLWNIFDSTGLYLKQWLN